MIDAVLTYHGLPRIKISRRHRILFENLCCIAAGAAGPWQFMPVGEEWD
jgi:hypothetical protein